MSTKPAIAPIGGTVTVGVPVEQAFRVFTGSFNTWWPSEYHIGQADVAEPSWNRGRAVAGTNAASTAASAIGAGCWPGSHPAGWSSPGRSTTNGGSTPTLSTPARSKCGSPRTDLSEVEQKQITEEYLAIAQAPGVLEGDQLQPADTATTVRVEGGRTLTTDGPYIEMKEALGGHCLYEADNLDAAIELAARIPAARMGGGVEVRRVVER